MSFEVLPGSSPDPAPRPGLLDRSRELAGRFGARRRPAPSDPGASQPSPPGDPGPPARALPSRTWPVAGAALVVVLLGMWWWLARDPGPPQITRGDVTAAVDEGITRAQEEARAQPPDAATAFRTIQPSLVVITTQLTGGASPAPTPAPTRGASGLGAGTVVNADGTILTALHVVDGGGRIEVTFADGTRTPARITDQQPEKDIAVLSVERLPELVVPAVLGGGVGIGDDVFAVGNPLGLTYSLSAGVVSALGRDITVDDGIVGTRTGRQLQDLIQFDAAVNPGNSGGPLLNRAGQVVGVVTGLANPVEQAFFIGIGFAVPIESAGGAGGAPPK